MSRLKNLRMLELRTASDKIQKEVAAIIGISQSSYAMIEGGHRRPRKHVEKKLADFFNVTVDELFFAEPNHTMRFKSPLTNRN